MHIFKKMCYSYIKYLYLYNIDYVFINIYRISAQIILKYIHACIGIYIYKLIIYSTHKYIM